jgi:hypothetical protein
MKLLIMDPSPASCHFFPLRSKHSFQHPILIILNLYSSHSMRDQDSHPQKTTGKIIVLNVFIEELGRQNILN